MLSLLVFMFKVKIDEKMHAKIVKELEAKLASGEIVDDEAQTAETVEAIDEEAKNPDRIKTNTCHSFPFSPRRPRPCRAFLVYVMVMVR